MSSQKANGDPLEGTIAVPNYKNYDVFNNVAMKNVDLAYGYGSVLQDDIAPNVPGTPTSSAQTDSTITLAWTSTGDDTTFDSGIASYKIYDNTTLKATVTAPALTTVLTGLTPSTAYALKVTAVDAHGNESAKSSALSISTAADATVPTVGVLSSPSHAATTVDLSWTAGTDDIGVTGYRAFNGGVQIGSDLGPSTFTLHVTSLTTATLYHFTVKAFDAAGNVSVASNTLDVTTS